MKFTALIMIPIIVFHILLMIKKSNPGIEDKEQTPHYTVKLPKAFFVIGCFSLVACYCVAIAIVLFVKDNSVIWMLIGIFLFSLLALALLTASVLYRIDVNKEKDYFDYHTSFGRHYTIRYNACSYKQTENALILYAEKKLFVDPYCINFDRFLKTVQRRCSHQSRDGFLIDG